MSVGLHRRRLTSDLILASRVSSTAPPAGLGGDNVFIPNYLQQIIPTIEAPCAAPKTGVPGANEASVGGDSAIAFLHV